MMLHHVAGTLYIRVIIVNFSFSGGQPLRSQESGANAPSPCFVPEIWLGKLAPMQMAHPPNIYSTLIICIIILLLVLPARINNYKNLN